MSTLKEVEAQETELKNKLDQTKTIDERRKIRAELRALRTKKEKLTSENGFQKPQKTVSSSPVVVPMNRRSDYFESKTTNYVEPVSAPKKYEGGNEVKVARSTYKFDMSSSKGDTESSNRRYEINQTNGSAIEEKRPRTDQDYNNNQENMDRGGVSVAPKRMSRRKSLVELFKIDEDQKGGRKPRMAQPDIPDGARLPVSGPPSSRRDVVKQDDQTKKDLIQNLGRLRSRRRSVREIQNRDELEGLMYVKQGDSVKLVSTSEGDEQVKEQRRQRRTSRKEIQNNMRIEGNTISYQDQKPEAKVLSPLKEESPSPSTVNQRFKYGTNAVNRPEPPRPASQPGRIGGRPGSTGPKSFLPGKEEAPAPAKLTGSVADRMKYFREQAELEKKKAVKQMPVKKVAPPSPSPAPAPTPPTTNNNQTKERVSIKKAPDPNKAPRELKKKPQLKRQMSVSSLILTWCKDVTAGYPGVNITNFSGSFANGLAFCALIHKFNPDKFDFNSLNAEDRWHNFQLAFETASSVGIPALLDVEDMFRLSKPEPRSVQCYVQMIFSKYRPKDLDMSNLRIA